MLTYTMHMAILHMWKIVEWETLMITVYVTVGAKTSHDRTQIEICFIAPAYSYTK